MGTESIKHLVRVVVALLINGSDASQLVVYIVALLSAAGLLAWTLNLIAYTRWAKGAWSQIGIIPVCGCIFPLIWRRSNEVQEVYHKRANNAQVILKLNRGKALIEYICKLIDCNCSEDTEERLAWLTYWFADAFYEICRRFADMGGGAPSNQVNESEQLSSESDLLSELVSYTQAARFGLLMSGRPLGFPAPGGAAAGRVCPSLFAIGEVRNLTGLVKRLADSERESNPLCRYLWRRLDRRTRRLLALNRHLEFPEEAEQAILLNLNRVVGGWVIYHPRRFKEVTLSPKTEQLLAGCSTGKCRAVLTKLFSKLQIWQVRPDLSREQRLRLNRMLLEDAFNAELSRNGSAQLADSEKLYLGIEPWRWALKSLVTPTNSLDHEWVHVVQMRYAHANEDRFLMRMVYELQANQLANPTFFWSALFLLFWPLPIIIKG